MFPNAQLTQLLVWLLTLTPRGTAQTYTVYPQEQNWADSKTLCESDGLQLVIIQSVEEINEFQHFLSTQINSRIWIGLRVPETSESERDFHWVDGSAMAVSDWDDDEPNNLDRMKCVLIQAENDDKWNTRPCSETHPFVCEAKAEKDSSLSRFAKFTVKPWTNNCDSDRNTVQLTSHSIITCCATCFAHDTCHMITWNHSTCGIVLDSDAVPCYCKNNCVAYKMLHHFVPKQISFVRAK